jgi:hypothetical protein
MQGNPEECMLVRGGGGVLHACTYVQENGSRGSICMLAFGDYSLLSFQNAARSHSHGAPEGAGG